MLRALILVGVLCLIASSSNEAFAQNPSTMSDSMPPMRSMPRDTAHKTTRRDSISNKPGMRDSVTRDTMAMPARPGATPMNADAMMIGALGISMARMGSGTTWVPDAVSIPSRIGMVGKWMLTAHGFAFVQYDKQRGDRGAEQTGSLNWGMLMATRKLAGGRFQARAMLSLDAAGVTNRGYPLLLQTGETFKGVPLHDRQHPHDFWMELGALFQREISKSIAWSVYAAPSGEPALGPVAFMHRPSAMDNLTAPLGHHFQDATHVSFGVVTGGIFSQHWQLEGSVFNGREPDENRWDFDSIHLDSYSGRITLNPSSQWSFSAGYGFLKSPETPDAGHSMHRTTASILYGRSSGERKFASALIWGANKHSDAPHLMHSGLFETEAIFDMKNSAFMRYETVQRTAEDLAVQQGFSDLGASLHKHLTSIVLPAILSGFDPEVRFSVSALQLGYIREFARPRGATVGIGVSGTMNVLPDQLAPFYGSNRPTGFFIFLRARPYHTGKAAESEMPGMKM